LRKIRIDRSAKTNALRCQKSVGSSLRLTRAIAEELNLRSGQIPNDEARILDERVNPTDASGSLFERVHAQMERFAQDREEKEAEESFGDTQHRYDSMEQLSSDKETGKVGDVDDSFEKGEDSDPDRNGEVNKDAEPAGRVEATDLGTDDKGTDDKGSDDKGSAAGFSAPQMKDP
jgi:hypothetical protein